MFIEREDAHDDPKHGEHVRDFAMAMGTVVRKALGDAPQICPKCAVFTLCNGLLREVADSYPDLNTYRMLLAGLANGLMLYSVQLEAATDSNTKAAAETPKSVIN